jgi:hypothetical protein
MDSSVSSFIGLDGEIAAEYSSFSPISELRAKSDVTLYFLSSNDVVYADPITDPWYSATTEIGNITAYEFEGTTAVYGRDDPVRVLGCTQSYQFCNPNLPNASCTPLSGLLPALDQGSRLWQVDEQRQMFNWISWAIWNMTHDIGSIVSTLDTFSLLSWDSLTGGFQVPLPSNQWELETENWFKIMLADLQAGILDLSAGPWNAEIDRFMIPPSNSGERKVCSSQKIRSTAFTSFTLLGLIIIFVVGVLIILVSALLPTFFKTIHPKTLYKNLEWTTNDTLQLQRLAHEALGKGTWTGAQQNYPKTKAGEVLATLDVTDPEHPRLIAMSRNAVQEPENFQEDSKAASSLNIAETPV